MAKMKANNRKLKDALTKITSSGIQADRKQLKKDMRAQFSNYREWIREYLVNAYDAMATYCRIYGEQDGDDITVTVIDDGKGMSRQRIEKFFTLYSSEKDIDSSKAIGTHGIGKLSIAAIPNQTRFEMETSDGKESWLAKAGKLDSEEDIHVQKLDQVRPHGTTFRITFKKKCSLFEEMSQLKEILTRYVRYLPIQIYISVPTNENEESHPVQYGINEDWSSYYDSFTQDYKIDVGEDSFEVQISIGENLHEIYQNKVLVSNNYDLVSSDLKEEWALQCLAIRVNGSSFELPFGRHCLSDEEILKPLSKKIRSRLLPQFMHELYKNKEQVSQEEIRTQEFQIDTLTCNLINYDRTLTKPWNTYEFIKIRELGKLSFKELSDIVSEKGRFFVEDESNSGFDYSYFTEPVLHHSQPGEFLSLLKSIFKEKCVFLKSEELVFEKLGDHSKELTEQQKTFEKNLGFHPGLFSPDNIDLLDDIDGIDDSGMDSDPGDDSFIGQGFFNEVEEACNDLSKLKWKASFLVEKDFKTPSQTHLFIYSNNTIILNLYHPLITKLVELSSIMPKLAGHWAISLCLEDGRNVFPYLSADTREELLMLDGIAKLNVEGSSKKLEQDRKAFKQVFNNFKKNLNDSLYENLN